MIIPSLEIVYPLSINLAPPGWRPQVNIIYIHDLGGSPKTTWHHDESGKTWISDLDFLGSMQDSVRVWAYGYNSEPAANMTPASIALHADELLESMMAEYRKYSGGPTIFIAHGFGGTIVKKVMELYTRLPEYFLLKDFTAGIVFLDTVHHPTDSDGVLKAVKTTVTANLTKHSLRPSMDEIREFSEAVREVNKTFVQRAIPGLLILNCVATRSIELTAEDGTSYKTRVVPKRRGEIDAPQVRNVAVDCNHFELTKFSSPSSQIYSLLAEDIGMMIDISAQNKKRVFFSMPPPIQPTTAKVRPPSPDPGTPGNSVPPPRPQVVPGPPQRDRNTEPYHLWLRKREADQIKRHRDLLLDKLGGWDQSHLGHDIHPTPGTCTWIQSSPLFLDWIKSRNTEALYISGGAGCGKTYLAKSVSNYLAVERPRSLSGDDSIVLSFFCNVQATGNRKPLIMQYFIWGILRFRPLWFESLTSVSRLLQDGVNNLDLGSLFEILRQFMTKAQLMMGPSKTTEVFLIVDGIQECDVSYVREFLQLIDSLVNHLTSRAPPPPGPIGPMQYFARESVRFKFFFTHAPNEIMSLASAKAITIGMTAANIRKDIGTYVDKEIKTILSVNKSTRQPELLGPWIKSNSESFFFFAKYSLEDTISTAKGGDEYGYSFNERSLPCPDRLGQYYDYELLPLFQSIENNNYVLSTIQIVLGAQRFINRDEIQDAIACLHDDPSLRFLDIQTVLQQRCCRLIHVSDDLELFATHPSLGFHFDFYVRKEQQHANMAFLCLKYLSQSTFGLDFRKPPAEMSRHHPFYNYASSQWQKHFRLSKEQGMKLLPLIGRFITSPCYKIWSSYWSWNSATREWAFGTPMYHAILSDADMPPVMALIKANAGHLTHELQAVYGATEFESKSWKVKTVNRVWKFLHRWKKYPSISRLLEIGCPAPECSVRDAAGHTPLMIAAMDPHGLPDMIKLFLTRTQYINERSFVHGDTALSILCRNLEKEDSDYIVRMISLFLEAGADPDISGFDGRTCLLEACERDSSTMVDLLLRAGANPNISTIYGVTPLREAFINLNAVIIERLVDYGADLNLKFPWPSDQTPLTSAIVERNFDLFLLLLRHVDEINQLDDGGLAAVHLLTAPEYIDWLPRLLERPELDLELLSDAITAGQNRFLRRTPLCFAIVHDNYKAVELLLEAGASPFRHPETNDDTPLYMAVDLARITKNKKSSEDNENMDNTGNVDIVELLLAYQSPLNTVNRKSKRYAKSPLVLAVYLKDQNMVELLLRHGADPTLEEAYGVPGALDAAIDDDEEVGLRLVKTLLENPLPPSINYVPKNEDDVKHILIETSGKKPELVQLLLDHGADTQWFLSPSAGHDVTPLLRAVQENNIKTCEVFIQHEPDLVTYQSEVGFIYETPIHLAAREGYIDIVRCLLDAGALPGLLSHHFQETPLWSACYRGRLEIAQLLYQKAPETLNTPSYDGNTPLMVACEAGDLQLVKFLLERGADIKARCSMGKSCVCSAVSRDNNAAYKIVDLLIQHGLGVDDLVDSVGFTVLGEACKKGDAQTVRMLLDRGASPAKGQRSPGNTSTIWRSALRIAVINGHAKVVDTLLEHPQLADFIENIDYYGENALHMDSPTAQSNGSEIATKIHWACQTLERETGIDYFHKMAGAKNLEMHTPVDIALGRLHRGLSREAVANMDETISQYITELTTVDERNPAQHKHLMRDLSVLLLQRGGYDEQAVRLLQSLIVDIWIEREVDRFVKTVFCTPSCDGCDEDEQDTISFCRSCRLIACQGCVKGFESKHDFVRVPVVKDRGVTDFNSKEVKAVLSLLAGEFVIEKKLLVEDDAPAAPFEVDPGSDETTLSLASLHAFGYLEFRRRAWSPYLPLSPTVYKRIQPWERMIGESRREFQEWVWETETLPFRLHGELDYFLEAGRRMAYKDMEVMKSEQVIRDLKWLFAHQRVMDGDERFPTRARGAMRQVGEIGDYN